MANTPIPNREYQAFVKWFKSQGYKGQWPPNIGGETAFAPGFGDIRENPYYLSWVSQKRPEPTPPPKWEEGVDPEVLKQFYPEYGTPEVPTPEVPKESEEEDWAEDFVPGIVQYNRKTNKYRLYGGGEITAAQAQQLLDQYNAQFDTQPTTRDWQGGAEGLALEREKFEWMKEQAGIAEQDKWHQMELQFERDRNSMMNSLPIDDWVRRGILKRQPNPYKTQDAEVSPLEKLGTIVDTVTEARKEKEKIYDEALIELGDWLGSGTPEEAEMVKKVLAAKEDFTKATEWVSTYSKAFETAKEDGIDWTRESYPKAPADVAGYVPGLEVGKEITKQRVPTPSGQQITAMSPSMAGRIGSYADWTKQMGGGRDWKDILAEASLMQPKTPFGRTSWSPAGARV